MIQKAWLSIRQQDISTKLYIVAFIIFLLAVSFIKLLGSSISLGMLYISMVLIEIGFIIWVYILEVVPLVWTTKSVFISDIPL